MSVFKKLTTNVPSDTMTVLDIRNLLYQHKDYLNSLTSTTDLSVTTGDARPYFGNLFGYLNYMKVPVTLHWPIMLLSNIPSPAEFDINVHSLRRPSIQAIEEILATAGL